MGFPKLTPSIRFRPFELVLNPRPRHQGVGRKPGVPRNETEVSLLT
jgi:hypothetical protein